jgi:hypothetical protein
MLAFAVISMFGCVTGSTVAHTTGTLAAILQADDHGHRHSEDNSIVHGVAHHQGMADHTHDTPSFLLAYQWVASPSADAWVHAVPAIGPFDLSGKLHRPPRS